MYNQGQISFLPSRAMEGQIAEACVKLGLNPGQLFEEALTRLIGDPVDRQRFLVFKGLPEVFENYTEAECRATELAEEDRDYGPFTILPSSQKQLAKADVARCEGVQITKIGEFKK